MRPWMHPQFFHSFFSNNINNYISQHEQPNINKSCLGCLFVVSVV